MERAELILTAVCASRFYIGQTPNTCRVAVLNFDRGSVTWTMKSDICVFDKNSDDKYMDSFFSFTGFIDSLNEIVTKFVALRSFEDKANQIEALILKRYPWNKFSFGCRLCPIPDMDGIEFNSQNILLYFKQIFDTDNIKNTEIMTASVKSLRFILNDIGIKNNSIADILKLDLKILEARLNAFDEEYKTYVLKLKQYHRPDDKNDVASTLNLGHRAGISVFAAHRFLNELERAKDPNHAMTQLREARLTKFSSK